VNTPSEAYVELWLDGADIDVADLLEHIDKLDRLLRMARLEAEKYLKWHDNLVEILRDTLPCDCDLDDPCDLHRILSAHFKGNERSANLPSWGAR
jgi:hypothetical protein